MTPHSPDPSESVANGRTAADDREAIREVIAGYCRAVDRLDVAGIRAAYHSDGVDHHTGFDGTADDFVPWVTAAVSRFSGTMHIIGNQIIELVGDTAICESYGQAVHWGDPADPRLTFTSGFRYVDHLEFRAGRWAIAERWAVREWTRSDAGRLITPEGDGPVGSRDADDPLRALQARLGFATSTSDRDASAPAGAEPVSARPDESGAVDFAARVSDLESRLAEVQDRLALMQIIASYGPAVDSGSAEVTADIWTEDGIYDVFPRVLHGRDDLADMVTGPLHQGLITGGAAHLQGPPHIVIHGDGATVTHYSQLVLRDTDTDSFRVWRTGVNVWTFIRTEAGWRATNRVNRQLDGTAEARDLLGAAVTRG